MRAHQVTLKTTSAIIRSSPLTRTRLSVRQAGAVYSKFFAGTRLHQRRLSKAIGTTEDDAETQPGIPLSSSDDTPVDGAVASELPGQGLASSAEDVRARRSTTAQVQSIASITDKIRHYTGRLAYRYFNWRKDTWNDLQLFATFNTVLLLIATLLKTNVVDVLDHEADNTTSSAQHFWESLYEALTVVFGQDLPDNTANVLQQLWSLMVAAIGLAAFALVLALVEQVVLEVLKNNVQRGSQVYETGHILVLGFCDNQRDEELIWKILSQVCLAYRNGEAKVAVVMTQRPKLVMESTFRRIIPEGQRFGTKFVFRQGSALIPDNLRMVAASRAAATIIVSDSSRGAVQADAQALRAAVLLDELDFPGFGVEDPRTGHIVVEMRTPHGAGLLKYSCSPRVLALPTIQLNARRIVRMVKHPVVGAISNMLWSFNSSSQGYIESFPQLQGKRFGELAYFFPDGSVFGLVNGARNRCLINPTAETEVEHGDQLIMMRPTSIRSDGYRALSEPIKVDMGDWDPLQYVLRSQDLTHDDLDVGQMEAVTAKPVVQQRLTRAVSSSGRNKQPGNDMYMLPAEYTSVPDRPEKLLILGWGDTVLMVDLLSELDHGPSALPKGSQVTLLNTRTQKEVLGAGSPREKACLQSLSVMHVPGDPLDKGDLEQRLHVAEFKCVIVLCDSQWSDPDLDSNNGIQIGLRDMLRIDAMLMMVQLNIRVLLEAAEARDVNIIVEKVAFDGVTRFEDRYRLPLGVTVNLTDYSAQLATEVAYNPQVLLPCSKLGESSEVLVQDASALAAPQEELSFWQLQARASTVNQVVFGFYEIPECPKGLPGAPLEIHVNPEGHEFRSQRRIWNTGNSRIKLISVAPKKVDPQGDPQAVNDANTSDRNAVGSLDSSPSTGQTNGSASVKTGKEDQANGSTAKTAADVSGSAPASSPQLAIKVGQLNLAAPGTANSANAQDVADHGDSDDRRQM